MAMRMLAAGGLPVVDDGHREPGAANRHGWFEDARVKRLGEDAGWLRDEVGRAVKVVLPLLSFVPPDLRLDVVRLNRPLGEVLASQRRLLALLSPRIPVDPREEALLAEAFERAAAVADRWLDAHRDARVLDLDFAETVAAPVAAAARLADFLRQPLDCGAMAAAIDPAAVSIRPVLAS